MKKIDGRVERDLNKFVDGATQERISNLKEDLLLWMIATEITRIGVFSATAQNQVRSRFGQEISEKLRSFLGSLSKSTAESIVFEKLVSVRDELEALIPKEFLAQISILEGESRNILRDMK